MISMLCSTIPKATTVGGIRDEVYVGAVPLRATRGPGRLLMSVAYSFDVWSMQHYMVLIRTLSHPQSQVIVFDFQPQDPENIFVATAALSGRSIPGVVLTRKLMKLPKRKCWFVGSSDDAVAAAHKFSSTWETDLRIGRHDCRSYTNGKRRVAEEKTGPAPHRSGACSREADSIEIAIAMSKDASSSHLILE